MRVLRVASAMIFSFLLGASILVCAQDKPDDKPQADAPKQQDAKPAQDEAKPANKQNDEMKQNDAKPSKDEKKEEKQDKQMQPQEQRTDQAAPQNQQQMRDHGAEPQPGHPAAAQGGNGRGGHIPDNQFHSHFGRSHSFHAQGVIVAGQPQFQYSGYTFELVDAWPAGWAYTDDCYIDYIDGEYFLFDLLHPGVRIAVFVVM